MNIPERGFYFHYKHDPSVAWNNHAYEVTGLAWHTEDETLLVVYRPLYEERGYLQGADTGARPLSLWHEEIEWEGKRMPRFTRVTDPELIKKLEEKQGELYGE